MEKNFNTHLGKKLRMRRLSLGLTQTKVANAINVTFQQIQKYEKGTNGVSSSRLLQLAVFLKVPVNYFYEDYSEVKLEEGDTINQETTDLNFSFLIKIFNKLTGNQKSKVLQILKNNSDLKETG
tara:strand:- start:47 stop:418 length:372 start_codon:yes stop_codon:yes gene_type:complete